MSHTIGDSHVITMIYGGSIKPPFIARDVLAVHRQHMKAEAPPGRRAGMQEDHAVDISAERSNII